jgi:hypothetical protein
MFNVAVKIKNNNILNKLLVDYKNLNIIRPPRYIKFIEDLEKLNYICVSTHVQFNHNAIVFIDTNKNNMMYVRFFDNYITIRRGEVLLYPWRRVSQKLVRQLPPVKNNDFTHIIDYLLYYRSKK